MPPLSNRISATGVLMKARAVFREVARKAQMQLRVAAINAEEAKRRLQVRHHRLERTEGSMGCWPLSICVQEKQSARAEDMLVESMQAEMAGEESEAAAGPDLSRFVGQLTGRVRSFSYMT